MGFAVKKQQQQNILAFHAYALTAIATFTDVNFYRAAWNADAVLR